MNVKLHVETGSDMSRSGTVTVTYAVIMAWSCVNPASRPLPPLLTCQIAHASPSRPSHSICITSHFPTFTLLGEVIRMYNNACTLNQGLCWRFLNSLIHRSLLLCIYSSIYVYIQSSKTTDKQTTYDVYETYNGSLLLMFPHFEVKIHREKTCVIII